MKKSTFLFVTCIFTLLGILFTLSCAVNPVTGKRQLALISESGEISLGKETDVEVRQQYGVYDDPALNEYITRIGMSMTPHTHRPQLEYHFAVLDTPVVNAFAVPGGYVYVTRGILAMMNSEAELAVVLGHELGHVNARHSVTKMSQLMLVQLGLAVGSALSETVAKLSGAASIGIQLLFLKFSRDDEREADRLGVQYSRSGGYFPGEMINFFATLQKLGDLSGGHSLPGFLSTHPLTSERVENTSALIKEEDKNLKVAQQDYLYSINNIIFGDDPRQGYVEGSAFYHPIMRFSFSFPESWTVQNTPAQVIMASKDGNAAVILQAEKSGIDLSEYARKRAEGIQNRQFITENRANINGLNSLHQTFDVPQQNQATLRVRMSFIRKGEYIYTFSALSTQNDFNRYNNDFFGVTNSFRELTNPAFINRSPQHLKLIKASGNHTLREIFNQNGVVQDEDLRTKLAIMNAMELGQIPKKNQLVKVIK
ncbi:MAG: M48 family metalloprotease [Candidatus Aminicenantes bacterium]|nr:M48 family metalloprotease [Candidatus Aminicenantes bacterium]